MQEEYKPSYQSQFIVHEMNCDQTISQTFASRHHHLCYLITLYNGTGRKAPMLATMLVDQGIERLESKPTKHIVISNIATTHRHTHGLSRP